MKKVIFLLSVMLCLFAVSSYARFENLVKSVDAFLTSEKGYVVSVDGDVINIDITSEKGAFNGKVYKVSRESGEIKHPITGQILGKKKQYVATIVITDAGIGYSSSKIIDKKSDVKPADILEPIVPLKTKITTEKFDKRLELLLREDLSKSNNIISDENADSQLIFIQDSNGGIKMSVVIKGNVVKSAYFTDVNINLDNGKTYGATTDLLRSGKLDKDYRAITVGKIFKDDFEYVVLAGEKFVDVYKFTGSKFELVTEIKENFSNIVSIESADLDRNGIDEIYVSNIYNNKEVQSYIIEFDGKTPNVREKNVPYIFRTISENGIKKVVCQRVTKQGEYIGLIHYYDYVGGFKRGEPIEASKGFGIFGFGYADLDGDSKKEVLWIDDEFKMRVYSNGQEVYRSLEYFNQNPLYFLMNDEVRMKEQRGYSDADNPIELKKFRRYLKNRLYVNEKNELFVLKNTPILRALSMLDKYSDSAVGRYLWQAGMLRKSWESDLFEPIIVDYYVREKYNKYYGFILRTYEDGFVGGLFGGLFKNMKSEIIYVEIK